MKKNTILQTIFSIFVLTGLMLNTSGTVQAQCFGNMVGVYSAPTVISSVNTTSCISTGDAVTVTGLVAGNTYLFDNCNYGTFDSELTLWDAGQLNIIDYNDDYCGLSSGILFTPTVSGDYELVVTELGCLGGTGGCSEVDITLVSGPAVAPGNDLPCNAVPLAFNTSYIYGNGGATVDAGETAITPPLTSCLTGWCDTGIETSIWFTFVAPASGFVEIDACNAGTNFDTQLAVYSATNCNDYTTFSYIGANDDGTGCTAYASNLTLGCLTPGATYYLLVDGYQADTGLVEIFISPLTAPTPAVTTTGIAPDCPGGLGTAVAVAAGWPPFTYSWSTGATTNAINALPGQFDVTITDGCGTVSATSTVTIPGTTALTADAGADQTVCAGGAPVSIGGSPATGGNPFDGSITGYGFDALTGDFVKFPISDPTATTPIGAGLTLDVFAGDFTPNGFLALDYTNNALISIDTVSGTSTLIGAAAPVGLNQAWTGLAWNSTNNTLYATSTDIATSVLYTVNPSTGAVTQVGSISGVAGAIWLAINNSGQGYTMDIVTDNLYSVNLTTGAATLIGPIGFDANYIQDADFDPVTGVLYLAAYNNATSAGELRSADLNTGLTTFLGDLGVGGLMEISAFGVVNSGGNPYTYQWSPATGLSNPNILNPTASPATTTTYTLTVSDECGTVATDAVLVTVAPAPVVNLGPDVSNCNTSPVTLNAGNPGSSYLWCNGSTTQTVTATMSGMYCVTVINAAGCSDSDSVMIALYTPPTASAGQDASICNGASANLNASASGGGTNYSYSWSNGTSGSSATVNPATTTTYTVTVTDNNGCSDTDDVVVTVNAIPTANAGQDDDICAGSSAQLSGSGQGGTGTFTYSWSNNNTSPTQTVSPATTTTYTLTVTDGNLCSGSDNVTITVNQAPVANAGADVSICEGASANLSGTATGGGAPYTFSWNNGVNGATQSVTPVVTTTYTFTSIDANGCSDTDNITVTVNPVPAVPTFTVNTSTGVLSSSAGAGNQWYLNGNPINGATGMNYTATTSGSYHVCVTNAQGCTSCSAPQSVELVSIGSGQFIVPVTILPNPVMDYLQIVADENVKSIDYTVRIYNTVGQLMYENQMTSQQLEVRTADWSDGIYTIQFSKDGNFAGSAKVVKN
ncbi:MAG: T9SS type A sorting domain-containing protein [Bacteroidia bacterium]|nr:T9SS type A sorting domain-containing protein [Bacteroidia bacterium]